MSPSLSPSVSPSIAPPTGYVDKSNILISLETGKAFVDFKGVELSDWIGHKIRVIDSSNKEIVGYIKAAGTGETYGPELLKNPAFEDTTNLWTLGSNIDSEAGGQTGN